jgi:hypothetical protein
LKPGDRRRLVGDPRVAAVLAKTLFSLVDAEPAIDDYAVLAQTHPQQAAFIAAYRDFLDGKP